MRKLKHLLQYVLLYLSGIWLLFRRANRRKMLILMYHGVVEKDIDIWTQVPAEEFDRQMRYLKSNYNVVPLTDAVDMISGKKDMPDYTAAITFDDGFLNNKTQAYSILKKYNLPATIFLATSLIDESNNFEGLLWPDYVICLIREASCESLDLSDLGLGRHRTDSNASKDDAINNIVEGLKKYSNEEKIKTILEIKERVGIEKLGQDSNHYRGMSWDDVIEFDNEGLISFGAHTVNHPILSRVSNDEIKAEILDSQQIIGQRLKKKITTFAYPNGNPEDYNDFARSVAEAHFDCTLTTSEALNGVGEDMYALRRIGLGNKAKLWEFKLAVSRAITAYLKLIGK